MEQHRKDITSQIKKISQANKNKGYMARFIQTSYIDEFTNDFGGETLICVALYGTFEEMDIDYYKENAYKLLAKQNAAPKVSVDDALTGELDYTNKNIKNLLYNEDWEPTGLLNTIAYYTLDGKLVANSYEQAEEYINNKYVEPEEELEQEQPEVNIYEEE